MRTTIGDFGDFGAALREKSLSPTARKALLQARLWRAPTRSSVKLLSRCLAPLLLPRAKSCGPLGSSSLTISLMPFAVA